MFEALLPYLNITQLLVVATFLFAVFRLPRSTNNLILLAILSVCLFNEVASMILIFYNVNNSLLFTIDFIIHNMLWLFLLSRNIKGVMVKYAIISYLGFCVLNLFFIEEWIDLNYNAFIAGALLYISVFILESFKQLKTENFDFFYSNLFILMMAPILFFLGLSFIFGFRSHSLSVTEIFDDIHLYGLIGIVVNLIYYSLINFYIFSENKMKHG